MAAIVRFTVPGPVPDEEPAMEIQFAAVDAVQAQDPPADTPTLTVPPAAAAALSKPAVTTVISQLRPACVMLKPAPPMFRTPLRGAREELGSTA